MVNKQEMKIMFLWPGGPNKTEQPEGRGHPWRMMEKAGM